MQGEAHFLTQEPLSYLCRQILMTQTQLLPFVFFFFLDCKMSGPGQQEGPGTSLGFSLALLLSPMLVDSYRVPKNRVIITLPVSLRLNLFGPWKGSRCPVWQLMKRPWSQPQESQMVASHSGTPRLGPSRLPCSPPLEQCPPSSMAV